jgi:hypothetical protein
VTVYLIRTRDEAGSKVQAHIQHLRNTHKMRPAFVKIDGAGEFRSNALEEWSIKEGIQHDISPARDHERNGLAERKTRTIQDRMRVFGNASSTSKSLWGKAAHYAAYTRGRAPCSSNPTTTPEIEFLGEKLDT